MPERGRHRAASPVGVGPRPGRSNAPEGWGVWIPLLPPEGTHWSCSAHRPWYPAPQLASAAKGLSAQQGHKRHRSGCPSLGLAPPSCCAHGTEQTPTAKSPCSYPSPANPRPSSSKHPTWKEQHHHGHNRTPAVSTQGKGQPQTPETSLPQPRGARNGAKLAPGPPASPTAIGNLGWALPPATRPQPRSRHKQGNKNPFGRSSPCSQRIISQLKGHKGI